MIFISKFSYFDGIAIAMGYELKNTQVLYRIMINSNHPYIERFISRMDNWHNTFHFDVRDNFNTYKTYKFLKR